MKTYRRRVSGISGISNIRFTLKACPLHRNADRSIVNAIIPAGSNFDYHIMIAVGILRFLMDYQRSEIQILMESRGIPISTGEISFLSEEFLLRFYCIHRKRLGDLKMRDYILHLDGTGESGDEIVFMAKDGITGITIDATIMPSENSDFITPFLKSVKISMGIPAAVLRDMGRAIRNAVSEVFPDTLQIICHYHFIRDLGRDVFGSYGDLRATMVSTKALAAISSTAMPENGSGIIYAEKLWSSIAAEYILYPRTIPSRFPFVLPYLVVLERCMEVKDMLNHIIACNASRLMKVDAILDLNSDIEHITKDKAVMGKYSILSRTWAWFEEVRKALRVARDLSSGSSQEPVSIETMGKDLNQSLQAIMDEGAFTGGELERISIMFRDRIEDHRVELLSPVLDHEGKQIHAVRHNGIEEIGHRWSRMHIRRRTGRSQTTREMTRYGALTAVLSNMENTHYIESILSKIDFLRDFTSVTKEEVNEARKLIRPNPCKPTIPNDRERKPALEGMVKILEIHEDAPEMYLESWVKSLNI